MSDKDVLTEWGEFIISKLMEIESFIKDHWQVIVISIQLSAPFITTGISILYDYMKEKGWIKF